MAPLAVLAGLAGIGAVGISFFIARRRAPFPATLPEPGPAPALAPVLAPSSNVDWFGGSSRENVDGLAFMFASENEHASLLVWALQALAANNFARQLARTRPRIRSIADMLKSGVKGPKGAKVRLYGLDWGKQYDKATGIKRFASTARGRERISVTWPKFEMAERLLSNSIDLYSLRGHRGELVPPVADWRRVNSFLQYENFGEIVQRQVGDSGEHTPESVLDDWGNARLIASVEGIRFYEVRG